MSDNIDIKTVAMVGLGAIAALSAWQVFSLSSKLDKQNDQIIELAKSSQSNQQVEKKEEEVKKGPSEDGKSQSIQDTINTMLLMEINKRLGDDSTNGSSSRQRRLSLGSFDESQNQNAHSQQSSANTISKQAMSQLQTNMSVRPRAQRTLRITDDKISITRILLTGGPCAGKTTAMAAISQDLTQLGYKVLVVPEAATLIMKGGAMIVSNTFTEQQGLSFQKALMKMQIALEEVFCEIGLMVKDQHVVLLIDRGLLDGSAYVSKENWQALLDDTNLNMVMLRDARYDAVLHMVTAADGAEDFYASLNNEARYESVSEAVDKDTKLREAYMGHQKYYLIDNNCQDFNTKINRTKGNVHEILGLKRGTQFYRKFLLKKSSQNALLQTILPIQLGDSNCEESQVIETFIRYQSSEGKVLSSSIEKKGSNKCFTYTHKIQYEKQGQKILKKRSISAAEYIELEQTRDSDMKTLVATRICTIDQGIYQIMDYYPQVDGQPVVCIIQINENEHQAEGDKRIKLPNYLKIARDITDLDEFQPDSLAHKDYKMSDEDKLATKAD